MRTGIYDGLSTTLTRKPSSFPSSSSSFAISLADVTAESLQLFTSIEFSVLFASYLQSFITNRFQKPFRNPQLDEPGGADHSVLWEYSQLKRSNLKQRSFSSKFTTEFKFFAMNCQYSRVWVEFARSPPTTTIDNGRPLQFLEICNPISSKSRWQSCSPNTLFRNKFQLLSSSKKPTSRPQEPLNS
ncbi:mitochondrial distribution and morphology protein 10 [Striga asiatica]|uniref:Mitochondrial distribution and morphology protein 10 n=1 Tax=Striga asiatica TaxID=4170 RepID=A0A5A7R7Y7_STRAF|nr:mitochondrial distribution and morphology protein 10 [Striga asiatica]